MKADSVSVRGGVNGSGRIESSLFYYFTLPDSNEGYYI
jgi:hypothetical protein